MNLGKWKTLGYRFYAYVSLFTFPNTVMLMAGISLPLYVLLPIEITPALIIMWKLDANRILTEEVDYLYSKSVFLSKLSKNIEDIKSAIIQDITESDYAVKVHGYSPDKPED